MRDQSNRSLGRWGEDRAAAHYRSQGFDVVDRNWRSPLRELRGELDVIACRADLIVFCEVKTRRSAGYGGAAVAVDETKQIRIRSLAQAWLQIHVVDDPRIRFDVVAIEGVTLTHIEAAF